MVESSFLRHFIYLFIQERFLFLVQVRDLSSERELSVLYCRGKNSLGRIRRNGPLFSVPFLGLSELCVELSIFVMLGLG